MCDYLVNKFVSIIKVGIRKYYIKHGILSAKSYVLEFDAETAAAAELLDQLALTRILTSQDAMEAQHDDDVANLVSFLIQEGVLVSSHLQDVEHYYGLLKSFGDSTELGTRKVLFVVSSGSVQEQIERDMTGMNLEHAFSSADAALETDLAEFALISVVYAHYAPDVFHKLNDLATRTRTPLQVCYLDGSTSFVSPIFVRPETVCYNEMEIQLESAITHRSEYLAYKAFDREESSLPPFLMNQIRFFALHMACDFLITGNKKGTLCLHLQCWWPLFWVFCLRRFA